ncbi:hypothetical protein ACSBR2_029707 [Camellia fascicularis]
MNFSGLGEFLWVEVSPEKFWVAALHHSGGHGFDFCASGGAVVCGCCEAVEITEVKKNQQEAVSEVDSMEPENIEEVDAMSVEEKTEVADVVEENGIEEEEEDEDEWDEKSWDDADLKPPGKNAFADEEADTEPEPLLLPKKSLLQSLQGRRKHQIQILNQSEIDLQSPICYIMGHVDTGTTKLLDCICGTNVQEGEAGGITQQIRAAYFPAQNIRQRTKELKADAKLNVPETVESLNLLKMRNTEFIVALNKVDILYGRKVCWSAPIVKEMKQQSKDVQIEFNTRLTQILYTYHPFSKYDLIYGGPRYNCFRDHCSSKFFCCKCNKNRYFLTSVLIFGFVDATVVKAF